MIVRNWMQADPLVVASDMLVSEANRILSESNLHALPVVDDGRLRGLVTRANLLRMDHFVLSTQDPDELDYFSPALKVRDVMVRNPATVQADDTMQHCLRARARRSASRSFRCSTASAWSASSRPTRSSSLPRIAWAPGSGAAA